MQSRVSLQPLSGVPSRTRTEAWEGGGSAELGRVLRRRERGGETVDRGEGGTRRLLDS